MSSDNSSVQQFSAVVFSALMITSMVVGFVALGVGTSTAATGNTASGFGSPLPGGVIDNTPNTTTTTGASTLVADVSFSTAGNVTNVTVNATGGDAGSISSTSVRSVTVELYSGGSLLDERTRSYQSHNETVSFGTTAVENVDQIVVTAEVAGNAGNGEQIDAELFVQTNPVGTINTAGVQTVDTTETGFISGLVSDTNNNDIQNATIRFRSTDGTLEKNTTTDSDGKYTIELPSNQTYNATVFAGEEFTTAEAKDLEVKSNKTTSANFVVRRIAIPTFVLVEPKQDSAIVGDNNTFTVTLLDQDRNPLSNSQINASIPASAPSSFVFSGANGAAASGKTTTAVTDENGTVTFTVTSEESATDIPITFASDTNASARNQSLKTFIISGEGSIEGSVFNEETTEPVAGASVWAVLESRYRDNYRYNNANITALGETDDNVIFIRLIDNETGEVIDNDEYDFRVASDGLAVQNIGAFGTAIRKIEELNVSNASKGSGYAIIDRDDDGRVGFSHTRLADQDYYAQVSFDAANVSDQRVADEGTENFVNVSSGTITGSITGLGGDAVVFEPTANLTLAATQERANRTIASDIEGTNPVDAPGFFNSDGVNTGGTNATSGQYKLTNLFTDFQAGKAYVAIATKPGFTTDFADVYVTEDGRFVNEEGQSSVDFNIDTVDVEPAVNITNIARLPDESAAPADAADPDAYDGFYFRNQTDLFNQPVPRDNDSVDVILVETTDQRTGNAINDSVTLEVPDLDGSSAAFDFEGEFVAVAGGTELAGDGDSDTIRIATGADGQAIVWLNTDLSTTTFQGVAATGDLPVCREETEEFFEAFSGVTAQSNTNLGATDASCKLFGGVTRFASINGLVTDEDNDPIANATVWVDDFELTGKNTRVTITRLANGSYNVSVFDTTTVPDTRVESQIVSGDALRDYRFSADFSASTVQTRGLEPVDNTRGFTLLTNSREQADNLGEYTLPRVPAEDIGNDYELEAREQTQGLRGQGDARNLEAGRTDDAGVVIPFDLGTNFQVQNLQAPATATAGDTINVTADVENIGAQAGQATVEFRLDLDGDGTLESDEVVATQTTEPLSGNETVMVEFTVDTTGIAPDTYDHGVFTTSDSETAQITLEEAQSSLADRFDTDPENGNIERSELFDAIDAFQNENVNLDRSVLFDIIDEFQTDNPTWDDV